ncbi:MAG: hypothetical protein KAJ36_08400 [Candidatus Thorarchaeota archaeon]|nr:hypothetical protein [Candidatus Thorarchaeota archaeon]
MFEEFSPPEKGLNPGEEIVWSRRAGMAARMMLGGACCLLGSPWILLLIYASIGPAVGNILLIFVLIGLLLSIVELVNSRRTMYYLTTTRIVEARGGLLRGQIPLEAFQGVSLEDYIVIKSTYTEGAKSFYQARVRDPISGKFMILTGLDEDAKEIIQKIAD